MEDDQTLSLKPVLPESARVRKPVHQLPLDVPPDQRRQPE